MTHKITDASRKLVAESSGHGLDHETIALLLGISDKTLRRRYRKELNVGMAQAHAKIAKTTFQRAMKGDKTMLIWYEKTRMGKRETVQVATPPGEAFVSHNHAAEPELIGAYFARVAASAATGGPTGADPGPDQGVGEGGQESHRQGGNKAPGEG